MNDEHGDLAYYNEFRWISRGRMMKRFFDLRDEIKFLWNKGESQWASWMMNLF